MSSSISLDRKTTYKWKVDRFSSVSGIGSPKFSLNGTSVYLWLQAESPLNLVSIHLQIYSANKSNLCLRSRISLLKENGEHFIPQEGETHLNNGVYISTWQYSIYRDYLTNLTNGLLINDKITIYGEVEDISQQINHQSNKSNFCVTTKPINSTDWLMVDQKEVFYSLSEDLESLLQSGQSSDVILLVGGGEFGEEREFQSHKLILSARSRVFAAMFDHSDTKEAQESRVHIADIGADVFGHFLRFIYTDKIELLDEFGLDLLAVADKYQVECLKQICVEYLQSHLTTSTVIHILLVADLHQATELKTKCIDYITDNVNKVKKESEGWEVMLGSRPELLMHLMMKLTEKMIQSAFMN